MVNTKKKSWGRSNMGRMAWNRVQELFQLQQKSLRKISSILQMAFISYLLILLYCLVHCSRNLLVAEKVRVTFWLPDISHPIFFLSFFFFSHSSSRFLVGKFLGSTQAELLDVPDIEDMDFCELAGKNVGWILAV